MAGLPAPASAEVPFGFRLREEGVDETWGLMDQLPLKPTATLRGDATPASCTTARRLLLEEVLRELLSPGLLQLPCKKRGR